VHRLEELSVDDLVACSAAFRGIGAASTSMEAAARSIARYLHECLVDADGERACALVRLYKTCRLADLPDDLQDFARDLSPDVQDRTPCLTLLGTAGDLPDWNDRRRSRDHRAIPLLSEEAVQQSPMIAGLIQELGLELRAVVAPATTRRNANLHHRDYDVFFVPDAVGSPLVPAQDEFVLPHGIRSVVGCGGVLPSGDLFALIVFSRLLLREETADLFRTLALSVKATVVPFTFDVFEAATAPGS
jgi:two-component system, NtrC family, sensor kinase